jgi:hypothetical protein
MINESNQVILSLTQHDLFNLTIMALGVTFLTILSVNFVLNIFFVLSVHKTMRMVPEGHHSFPPGLLWLIIIPGIGYVFEWIMLPFGVPRALESYFKAQGQGDKRAHMPFFGLGLAAVIVQLAFIAPFVGAAVWILKIIYWAKMVNIRTSLLAHKTSDSAQL